MIQKCQNDNPKDPKYCYICQKIYCSKCCKDFHSQLSNLVTGEEIEGAELQVVDEEGNIVDEWTSTKEPHKVPGLEEGKKYTLIEKTAPYGYELTEKIEFEVTTDKETQKVEMKDMPILKDIQLTKIDSKSKEVIKEKFTFGLYKDEECLGGGIIKEVRKNGTKLWYL